MPAYNEAPTIVGVLDDLYPRVDRLVIVNDGSADGTGAIVDSWAAGRERVHVIHFPENRGLSAALNAGWDFAGELLRAGEVSARDVVFSIDADGQHEPAALDGMIAHLVEENLDCVIGQRDLGYHTPYKRFGNAVMTWIARACGGMRFEDVESGYRIFRIGPLLDARQYYAGYRYSETVEVAVILARLGYRVCNSYGIQIPVARTRTRLKDAAIDAACMPLAAYRLAAYRGVPRAQRSPAALWAASAVIALSALAIALMLAHAFYLGDDSAHSYAHVWYLSHSIWDRHELPASFPQLENGDGVTFPYAAIPWLPAALVYPLIGDWAVTLSMALGVVGMIVALPWWRPAFRNPVLLALFLANPLLWNGITQFQLATLWAFLFVFLGAGLFERRKPAVATAAFAAALYAHPMMGGLGLALYAAFEAARSRRVPWRLVACGAVATAVAAPAIYWFFSVPALHEARGLVLAATTVDNLRRLSVVALALAIPAGAAWVLRHQRALLAAGAAGTAAVLLAVPPSGLWSRSHPQFDGYLAEHPVAHDGSYRVMTTNNREDGMVELLRAGAVLSDEFFTESVHRQDFPSLDAYQCLLATKDVRHVLLTGDYQRHYRKNEPELLAQLEGMGLATKEFEATDGTIAYRVTPDPDRKQDSLRGCHL